MFALKEITFVSTFLRRLTLSYQITHTESNKKIKTKKDTDTVWGIIDGVVLSCFVVGSFMGFMLFDRMQRTDIGHFFTTILLYFRSENSQMLVVGLLKDG